MMTKVTPYNAGRENSQQRIPKRPGDIGTSKKNLVQFDKAQQRFNYKREEARLRALNNESKHIHMTSLENLSNHRHQKTTDFKKATKRINNVFAPNKFV